MVSKEDSHTNDLVTQGNFLQSILINMHSRHKNTIESLMRLVA